MEPRRFTPWRSGRRSPASPPTASRDRDRAGKSVRFVSKRRHRRPTPGALAQWQSSGLLIRWFRVRVPDALPVKVYGEAPEDTTNRDRTGGADRARQAARAAPADVNWVSAARVLASEWLIRSGQRTSSTRRE